MRGHHCEPFDSLDVQNCSGGYQPRSSAKRRGPSCRALCPVLRGEPPISSPRRPAAWRCGHRVSLPAQAKPALFRRDKPLMRNNRDRSQLDQKMLMTKPGTMMEVEAGAVFGLKYSERTR